MQRERERERESSLCIKYNPLRNRPTILQKTHHRKTILKIIFLLSSSILINNAYPVDKASFTKINKPAQNFALFTLDGKERKILTNGLKNIPPKGLIILNFTSYTCKPCKKEIPELQDIVANHGNGRVKLWIIYTDSDREKIRESAKSIGITNTILVDVLGSVARDYNVKKIPTTFVIYKDMNIKVIITGYSSENMVKLEEYVKARGNR